MDINPTRFYVMKTNLILWLALSLLVLTGCDIIKLLADPQEKKYRETMLGLEDFEKVTLKRLKESASPAPDILCAQGQANIDSYQMLKTEYPDKKEEIDQKIGQWESILSERCD